MAENHPTWPIECLDFAGRSRTLNFIAVPRIVIVKAPPGEVALLKPADIDKLREAALEAMVAAARLP